jgi:peptidoglycan hydrolase-like protein with peptidoglycan-binding domain
MDNSLRHLAGRAGLGLIGLAFVSSLAHAQPVAPLAYAQPLGQNAVRSVQQRLHDLGIYNGTVDGVWGRDSEAALMRFQQAKGLQVNGHLNQSTAATLGISPADLLELPAVPVAALPAVPPLPAQAAVVPLGADTIRLVQGRLQQLGYVSTPADGVWGPSTQAGVESVQRARGLPISGQLNAQTMTAMGLDPGALVQGH